MVGGLLGGPLTKRASASTLTTAFGILLLGVCTVTAYDLLTSRARDGSSPTEPAVTADTALRLGKYFGVSAQFWLNLQTQYDLDVAEDRLSMQIDAITPLQVA